MLLQSLEHKVRLDSGRHAPLQVIWHQTGVSEGGGGGDKPIQVWAAAVLLALRQITAEVLIDGSHASIRLDGMQLAEREVD